MQGWALGRTGQREPVAELKLEYLGGQLRKECAHPKYQKAYHSANAWWKANDGVPTAGGRAARAGSRM